MAEPDISQIPGLEVPLNNQMYVIVVLPSGEYRKITIAKLIEYVGD